MTTLTRFLGRFHQDWLLDHPGGWREVVAAVSPDDRDRLIDELEELATSDLSDRELLRWVLLRGDGLPRTGDLEPGIGIRGSLRLIAETLR
jgi:hypothetical protein